MQSRRLGYKLIGACALALLPLSVGCALAAKARLQQPFAPPAQQDIRLQSDWSFTTADGSRRSVLLEFPLPGSVAGPRDFRVFLSLPDQSGTLSVDPLDRNAGRGFLIQEVGRYKGKTEFTSGAVALRRELLSGRYWRLKLDLTCRDGARLIGAARLEENSLEVDAFKRAFVGDIAAMEQAVAPPPPPASAPEAVPEVDNRGDAPVEPVTPTASRPVGPA